MKKVLLGIVIGVVLVVALAIGASMYFLGEIVKQGVETVGPRVTRVGVKLKSADVILFSGGISLKGLVLGNPPDYKSRAAFVAEDISVRIQPSTAFSTKVVVESVKIKSPEITLEGGLNKNNLREIQKNIDGYVSDEPAPSATDQTALTQAAGTSAPAKPARTFQVNELVITGAKLHLLLSGPLSTSENTTLTLPDIHLTGLGTGPDGITGAEIAQKTLDATLNSALGQAGDLLSKYGGQTLSTVKEKAKKLDFKKAGERLKGWFKSKSDSNKDSNSQ